MSETLARQIDEYFSYVDEIQGEISVESVREQWVGDGRVRPLQPPSVRPRLPQRRWLAAAAAATAVLVLVGGLAFLLRSPGADVPAATTPPDSGLTPLGISHPGSQSVIGAWSRVPHSVAALGIGTMNAVARGGPGFVAVGFTELGDDFADAVVWTSVDGASWTRVSHDDSFTDEEMAGVVAIGGSLVAVGSSVWISADGTSWTRVPEDDANIGEGFMHDVTAGGPGLVAVGAVSDGETERSAVWTSVDGTSWQQVRQDQSMARGSESEMRSVTVGGPGLVAVGIDWSKADADAALWTSVDGFAWTRVGNEETFGGQGHQEAWSVTAHAPGVVAVGVDRAQTPMGVVWGALDGINWSRTPGDGFALDFGEMVGVTSTEAGLVAVGWFGSDAGVNSVAAAWTSANGISWTRMSGDEEALGIGFMLDVVPGGPGLIAVGSDGWNAAVWTAPMWRPAALLGEYQDARNAGDVDGVMAFYTTDAVVIDHPLDDDGLASGVDEIRRFEGQIPGIQGSVGGIQLRDMKVSGDTVTFDYVFLNSAGTCFGSRDNTVTFSNGKIIEHDWGVTDQSLCG